MSSYNAIQLHPYKFASPGCQHDGNERYDLESKLWYARNECTTSAISFYLGKTKVSQRVWKNLIVLQDKSQRFGRLHVDLSATRSASN